MVVTDKYVLFWSGVFSNFAKKGYTSHDGIEFVCSEQEFMYRKAKLFKDEEEAARILVATAPKEIKTLGRMVRNYDEKAWGAVREEMMFQACLSKFSGNASARKAILSYPGKDFVEASPYDRIWGIGLKETDPRALDQAQWRGTNLLGKVLNRVRDQILAE